jgi:excisionase family DNA binding protein
MMLNKYPDVMTVDEVSEALGICRNKIYDLIRQRIIGSKKVGRRIIVPKVCLIDFLESSRYNISQ